ncbi:MAG: hypothetical protein ACP5H9_01925 [Candidatus Woesearchaeota archaeon]
MIKHSKETKDLKNLEMSVDDLLFYENLCKQKMVSCLTRFFEHNKYNSFEESYFNEFLIDASKNPLENHRKNFEYNHGMKKDEESKQNENFNEKEAKRIVEILENGLIRLKDICILRKVNFYSAPVVFYTIYPDVFYCGIDELMNSIADNYCVEINEEMEFVESNLNYTKISIVYDLNDSYVEVINRIFIDLKNDFDKSANKSINFYVTQAFRIDTKEDYEKLARTLLEVGIDSKIFEISVNENLEESKKNIENRIVLLPYLYFVFSHRLKF